MAIRLQPALAVHGKTRRPGAGPQPDRSLLGNQQGAIMVIGIFIAMMLVGMLYYVWGIGGAVLFRERMNDASDASAFSAAVVHARGMNILALLNIVMAALAAVESALQLAAEIIDAAAVAAGITCLGCGPWCAYCCEGCYYAIVYGEDAYSAHRLHGDVEDIIDPIMDFTHGVAVAVRTGSPIAAQALVVGYSQSEPYAPVVELGVMFPLLPSMQAEDDPDDWPCDEKVATPTLLAGEIVAPIEVEFDMFNPWYAAGALYGLARYRSIAREWCPDYFQHVPDDAQLGEDEFAIRTLMYGRSPHTWTRGGVALADWGRSEGDAGWMEAFEPLTWISFAQSEYFYEQPFDDEAHEHNEFLWHQRWRARLRRFRLPSGGDGGLGEACGAAGDACGSLMDLSSIVVH